MTIEGNAASAPLDCLNALPLLSPGSVASFGPTLVVAPHPDDESLGCGGAIALLRQREIPVRAIVVSDGTGSHRSSTRYGPGALRQVREWEVIEALSVLGVAENCVTMLRLPDEAVPGRGNTGFRDAVTVVRAELSIHSVSTVLVLWRRDPHCDHRATWEIVTEAVSTMTQAVRVIEYPIWVWDLAKAGDAPLPGEVHAWRLDISQVVGQKRAAIFAHRSQTTALIDDDPDGFRLTAETLEHFLRPWEVFLEGRP